MYHHTTILLISFHQLFQPIRPHDYPWTYDNDLFGGPDFWGLLNKKWEMCSKGKLQSPINIMPSKLLFDPYLTFMTIDKIKAKAEIINIGQMPRLRFAGQETAITVTGGPLKPYNYRLQRIDFHFSNQASNHGSEHAINFRKFPMEMQLIMFNYDIYKNFSAALGMPYGLAAISIIVEIGNSTHDELQKLTTAVDKITFKRRRLSINDMMPSRFIDEFAEYITYDGSLTLPGCYETVTWIIVNTPIYIMETDLAKWRNLRRTGSEELEPQFMAPNYRPLQNIHGRLVRTNIVNRNGSAECRQYLKMSWYRSN